MMRVRFAALLLTLGGFFTATLSAADDKWLEVKSSHFIVITNGNERGARNLAWQFEQIRSAIEIGWPWARVQLDRPVVVIGAKDEATMKMLVPQYWEARGGTRPASVFTTAADRHYIAVRSDVKVDDTPGINPYRSSYWSYSLLTFDAAYERELPLWFASAWRKSSATRSFVTTRSSSGGRFRGTPRPCCRDACVWLNSLLSTPVRRTTRAGQRVSGSTRKHGV